jgi:hypothetical protein
VQGSVDAAVIRGNSHDTWTPASPYERGEPVGVYPGGYAGSQILVGEVRLEGDSQEEAIEGMLAAKWEVWNQFVRACECNGGACNCEEMAKIVVGDGYLEWHLSGKRTKGG